MKSLGVLDVGCGMNPIGDVNVDRPEISDFHRPGYVKFDAKFIPNFVIADARFLPFRERCFRLVRASHVIEHLKSPVDALLEWKRVGLLVELWCPFRDGRLSLKSGRNPGHFHWFDKSWFYSFGKKFGVVVLADYGLFDSSRAWGFHVFDFWFLPVELHVRLYDTADSIPPFFSDFSLCA